MTENNLCYTNKKYFSQSRRFVAVILAFFIIGFICLALGSKAKSEEKEGIFAKRSKARSAPVPAVTPTPEKDQEKDKEKEVGGHPSAPGASPRSKLMEALKKHTLPTIKDVEPSWKKKITLLVDEIPISLVLRQIASKHGVNIISSFDISEPITLRLYDVPLIQALDIILLPRGLTYDIVGNLLIVKDFKEDFVTETYNVNYAQLKTLKDILPKMVSPGGWVEFEPATNTVIARGTQGDINGITKFIREVDAPPLQAVIEVKIVEFRNDFWRNSGISWGGIGNMPVTGSGLDGGSPNFYQDHDDRDAEEGGPSDIATGLFQYPGPISELNTSDLAIGFVWDHVSFDSAINLMQRKGWARVVNCPRIAVLNNSTGIFHKGVEVVYNMQSTNAGTSSISSSEFRDIGTKLEVTPHIAANGEVTMTLKVELSDVIGSILSENPPLSTINTETTLRIKDRHTAIISGMIIRKTERVRSKMPLIGDLPVMGKLFSNKGKSNEESELAFIITPRVIWEDRWPKSDITKVLNFLTPPYMEQDVLKKRLKNTTLQLRRMEQTRLLQKRTLNKTYDENQQLIRELSKTNTSFKKLNKKFQKNLTEIKVLNDKIDYYEKMEKRREMEKDAKILAKLKKEEQLAQKASEKYLKELIRQIENNKRAHNAAPKIEKDTRQWMEKVEMQMQKEYDLIQKRATEEAERILESMQKAEDEARKQVEQWEEDARKRNEYEIEVIIKTKK